MPTAANETDATTSTVGESEPALPLRSDTFLGVCQAVGEDLGFNPNWLRIPFAVLILWNPLAIVGCYLGLGCVVAASRWFFPANGAGLQAAEQQPAQAADCDEEERLAA
ncbi:MAG TPA: PspC domain-containing protein [Sphingomicrobium sp.]|nr:PspC domain-containing protein [Sphingomicrobium sp.]